jgi:hypothetical protein
VSLDPFAPGRSLRRTQGSRRWAWLGFCLVIVVVAFVLIVTQGTKVG